MCSVCSGTQKLTRLHFCCFFVFLNILFIDYAITVVLSFSLCPPPPSMPHSLRQSHHHCSCPWLMCISSLATSFPILYFTSPWPFCHYLFVLLSPLTSSPILPFPLSSENHLVTNFFSLAAFKSLSRPG